MRKFVFCSFENEVEKKKLWGGLSMVHTLKDKTSLGASLCCLFVWLHQTEHKQIRKLSKLLCVKLNLETRQ